MATLIRLGVLSIISRGILKVSVPAVRPGVESYFDFPENRLIAWQRFARSINPFFVNISVIVILIAGVCVLFIKK